MNTFYVQLTSINDVKQFVNAACSQMCEIDLISGRYTVDAKSIMGIFSLDLSNTIDLNIHSETEIDTILEALKPYIVG